MADSASRREFMSRGAQVAGGASVLAAAVVARAETSQAASQAAPREFRIQGEFVANLKRARKLALQGDRIHIAGDCEVQTYDAAGSLRSRISFARPVRCVAVDQGGLVVGMLSTIVRWNWETGEVARWSAPEGTVLSSLAAGVDEILGADAGAGVVWRWDYAGRLLGKISRNARFAAPAEFFQVVAAHQQVHVNNPGRHRIETFTAAGQHQRQWGAQTRDLAGFSGCCNPVSFAVLSDGGFVTAERGQPRVKHFDAEGRFLQELCGPDVFAENARASSGDQHLDCHAGGLDVAVDPRDQVVVLDRVTARVKILG